MTRGKPRVMILRACGTNCDRETAFAFAALGADADLVHVNAWLAGSVRLEDYHILAVPGGFTYGDDVMAGRILGNTLRLRLGGEIRRFVESGRLVLGICNGFQVLVRAGILPGPASPGDPWGRQTVSLVLNDSGRYEDRWVHLRLCGDSVWTEGLPEVIFLPVAHAEGKFVVEDPRDLDRLAADRRVVFRYCGPDGAETGYPGNPNGSQGAVAAVADATGRVLGMMPHPERHFLSRQHPYWTRRPRGETLGAGASLFANGVRYVRRRLLVGTAGETPTETGCIRGMTA